MLLLININIIAQVKVLSVKGTATINDTKILSGTILSLTDTIKITDNSYVSLTYNNKIVQFTSPGKYSIEKSFKSLVSNSLSKKYSEYVLNELNKKESIDIHTNYQKNMRITGSVERAVNNASINVCLPKTSKMVSKTGYINWTDVNVNEYTIIGSNLFEDELFSITTTKNYISLSKIVFDVPADKTISIVIESSKGSSNRYVIRFVNNSNDIIFSKAAVDSEYSDTTAINSVIKALFYADLGLFVEANTEFKNAINGDSSVLEYQNMYMNFLTKENLLEFYK